MKLNYIATPTAHAEALRAGGPDAYGIPAERVLNATGTDVPCRHCLGLVPPGRPYLIAAYRPFQGLNPYTETGPIFLCADACTRGGSTDFPAQMLTDPAYILRGYSTKQRIVPETGRIVAPGEIPAQCEQIFADPNVAFIHIRYANNNCFQCRVERA